MEKGQNQGSDTEQNADAKYIPNLPSVGCPVGPWLQRGGVFREFSGYLRRIFQILLTFGLWWRSGLLVFMLSKIRLIVLSCVGCAVSVPAPFQISSGFFQDRSKDASVCSWPWGGERYRRGCLNRGFLERYNHQY